MSSQVGFTPVRSSSLILRKQIRTVHVSGLEFPIQTNRLSSGANNDDINMLNSARFSPIDAPSRSTHATSKTQGNLTPPKRAVPSSTRSPPLLGTIMSSTRSLQLAAPDTRLSGISEESARLLLWRMVAVRVLWEGCKVSEDLAWRWVDGEV